MDPSTACKGAGQHSVIIGKISAVEGQYESTVAKGLV